MAGILRSAPTSSTLVSISATSATLTIASKETEASAILEQAMTQIPMVESFNSNGNDISCGNFDSIINKDTNGDSGIHIGSKQCGPWSFLEPESWQWRDEMSMNAMLT